MTDACGHARRVVWPNAGPRSADEANVAAQRHVESCQDCQAFFDEMAALRGTLRASIKDEATPLWLREEIYSRLAEARLARPSRSYRRWSVTLVAALIAAVLIVGAGVLLQRRPPGASVASVVAMEHARGVGGDRLSSTDRDEVERWLAARVEFAVHVPTFSDARLTGARISATEGGRGAIIEYAVGERTLSYFVLPSSDDQRLGTGITRAAESGYRMVLWQDSGLVHVLVGAFSHEHLGRFAKECIEQATRLARARGLLTLS